MWKAVVAAFNQEKALVEDFSMMMNLRMELFVPCDGIMLPGAAGRRRWTQDTVLAVLPAGLLPCPPPAPC